MNRIDETVDVIFMVLCGLCFWAAFFLVQDLDGRLDALEQAPEPAVDIAGDHVWNSATRVDRVPVVELRVTLSGKELSMSFIDADGNEWPFEHYAISFGGVVPTNDFHLTLIDERKR